jgi:hypothetical protein
LLTAEISLALPITGSPGITGDLSDFDSLTPKSWASPLANFSFALPITAMTAITRDLGDQTGWAARIRT